MKQLIKSVAYSTVTGISSIRNRGASLKPNSLSLQCVYFGWRRFVSELKEIRVLFHTSGTFAAAALSQVSSFAAVAAVARTTHWKAVLWLSVTCPCWENLPGFETRNLSVTLHSSASLSKHFVHAFCAVTLVMKEMLEQENITKNIGFYNK